MKKFLILMVLPILAFANVGKITVLKGDVQIKRSGEQITAKSGTTLEKNDFISTDKEGKVQIVFTDNTIFTIGKNSTLDIADYLYDESQPNKNTAKFNVLKGAFSSITGRIGKLNKSKFKLKTKSASIGIRGTIVKANQETIMCTEGAITVTTLSGDTVRVEAGYKTDVSTGTPSAPEAIQEGEAESLGVESEETVATDATQDSTTNDQQATTEEDEKATAEPQETDTITQAADSQDSTADSIAEDIASGATTSTIQNTETITYEGRTIDSSGKAQAVSINAANVGDDFQLSEEDLVKQGMIVDDGVDETISWGHWESDPSKKWVAGQTTDVKVLDDMRNNEDTTVKATYNGQVMGTVNGTDDIKMDSTNKVQMNLELGGGKNSMDGSIDFQTQSGQEWETEFTGTTSGNAFSSNEMTVNAGDETAVSTSEAPSSAIDGQFYGDNAEAVGGTFNLNTESNKATGVFKATK